MLLCYARRKVAIGTRCVSGDGLEKSLNTRLPIPEGKCVENLIQFSGDWIIMYN